ncbi:MAG TPA: glycosyltransferase [Longimicrobiales bacterium]|nr:glycosyltransferase [Longimicrobiales bacterium]
MARLIDVEAPTTLSGYEAFVHLAPAVRELREAAQRLAPALAGRTLWMVSSTAQGGGVAEMLPTMIGLLNELGVTTRWFVIETERPEFFVLTKRIHNLIHGAGEPVLTAADRELFESVSAANAEALGPMLAHGDVLALHDPQPLGLAPLLRARADVRVLWRCHIGLDEELPQTRTAWDFLRPYADACERVVFSAPEYVPDWLEPRSTIIHPAIDPLGPKNHDLWVHRLTRVMMNSALVHADLGPVLTPRWEHVAGRLMPSGEFGPADANGDIGLLSRPIVTQISRWDRLKGFAPLLDAFALLKRRLDEGDLDDGDPIHRRRIELARLVLAGPDPASIQDDPEAREVVEQLRSAYLALPAAIQDDVALLTLPMASREQNALMVNALQRASSLVVQNSLREGFGLTIVEAMWKQIPVLSNQRACGPRHQIRDGVDGRLARDPEDVHELSTLLDAMLAAHAQREVWGLNAQRRAHADFLVFTQVRRWIELLHELVTDDAAST